MGIFFLCMIDLFILGYVVFNYLEFIYYFLS